MPDIRDVMRAEKIATDFVNQLDEEAPIEKIAALGFLGITYAILAVGIRLDYAISRASNTSDGR